MLIPCLIPSIHISSHLDTQFQAHELTRTSMTRPAQFLRPYLHLHSRSAIKPTSSAYLRYYNILHSPDVGPDFLKPAWRHQLLKGETECPKWLYPRNTTARNTINRRILEEWGDHLEPDTLIESKKVIFNGKSRTGCRHFVC